MTFLKFSQFSESVFHPNFPGKHFFKNQAKKIFDRKIFFINQLF
jgi:hypothetical protein